MRWTGDWKPNHVSDGYSTPWLNPRLTFLDDVESDSGATDDGYSSNIPDVMSRKRFILTGDYRSLSVSCVRK
jgi:hypothetical protein